MSAQWKTASRWSKWPPAQPTRAPARLSRQTMEIGQPTPTTPTGWRLNKPGLGRQQLGEHGFHMLLRRCPGGLVIGDQNPDLRLEIGIMLGGGPDRNNQMRRVYRGQQPSIYPILDQAAFFIEKRL